MNDFELGKTQNNNAYKLMIFLKTWQNPYSLIESMLNREKNQLNKDFFKNNYSIMFEGNNFDFIWAQIKFERFEIVRWNILDGHYNIFLEISIQNFEDASFLINLFKNLKDIIDSKGSTIIE
ncbi:MAG: hypothetical protein ACTSRP_24475 [Candidatus Helarchaeota archaeon]